MANHVKALIWDFGGVLLRTEDQGPRREWERRLNLPAGKLHDLVFHGKTSRMATVGQASTDDIWHAVAEQLGLDEGELQALRVDFWAGDRLDHDLVDMTRMLHGELKTALLSNAWPDLRPYLEDELQIGDAFDLIVISSEEGIAKPDERIFRILFDRVELRPEECIFIDDSSDNILAASDLGMQAIIFQNRDQTIAKLHDLLPRKLLDLLPD
ncbi:MAG: HAD family phosphatase [Anaerolineales bacterium]|jgi:putative hydrolase of the HAD superfamily